MLLITNISVLLDARIDKMSYKDIDQVAVSAFTFM